MDLRQYLLLQYMTTHVVIDQQILPGLGHDQMPAQPAGGGNSAAWILWHATRCEDVAIAASFRRAYTAARPVDADLVRRWRVVRMADRLAGDGIPEERELLLRMLRDALE